MTRCRAKRRRPASQLSLRAIAPPAHSGDRDEIPAHRAKICRVATIGGASAMLLRALQHDTLYRRHAMKRHKCRRRGRQPASRNAIHASRAEIRARHRIRHIEMASPMLSTFAQVMRADARHAIASAKHVRRHTRRDARTPLSRSPDTASQLHCSSALISRSASSILSRQPTLSAARREAPPAPRQSHTHAGAGFALMPSKLRRSALP